MTEQSRKICNRKPGEDWSDGCCSPKPLTNPNPDDMSGDVLKSSTSKSSTQSEATDVRVGVAFQPKPNISDLTIRVDT
jgi:hypothetical protein